MLRLVVWAIEEKKAENPLVLDVEGISSLTDYVVIAEGGADRHVIAIGRSILETLKKEGIDPIHVEGMQVGDWIVLDYGSIMVHLFSPGFRQKYCLEALWPESKIIENFSRNSSKGSSNKF